MKADIRGEKGGIACTLYILHWDSTKSIGSFFYGVFIFSPFDGWLTFDGLRYTSFFDVTSNAWKLLSFEMQDDYGDYNEIRDSSEYSCATSDTLLNGAYDFDFGVKNFSEQTTFSMRSAGVSFLRTLVFLRATRHPADSDGRPTAGTQLLVRVPMVPWHPYHSGPALHCRVQSRSESC